MTPRFRLDPRAPESPVRAAPPPTPPPVAAPPPIAPRPPPRRVKWKWVGVGVLVLVVLVSGVAAFALIQGQSYPDKYLLSESEAPRGLSFTDPADLGALDGMVEPRKNPAKFTRDGLDDLESQIGARPDEAWGQVFDSPSHDGGAIVVVAAKFASEEEANDAVSRMRFVCFAGQTRTSLLQDGDVVVLVDAKTGEPAAYKERVVTALQSKASELRLVCSS